VKSDDLADVRRTLWKAADELRANSTLSPSEARSPILGLIFLAYAEHRFEAVRPELETKATARRPVTPDDYRAKSVLYISEEARLSYLVHLPEDEDLGEALDTAMRLVETHNPELKGVLPRGYQRLPKSTITGMLRLFTPLPRTLSGDAFGLIYEDFLSNFAMAEGRLGGEFFTPYSIVRLIVEIIEPFHGKVYDPACGSVNGFAFKPAHWSEHGRPIIKIKQLKQGVAADTPDVTQGRSTRSSGLSRATFSSARGLRSPRLRRSCRHRPW
jgi:type I restriction enzyme M protein